MYRNNMKIYEKHKDISEHDKKIILVLGNLSEVRCWTSNSFLNFPSPYFGPQCRQFAVPQPKNGPQCPYLAVPPHIKWNTIHSEVV